MKRFIPIVLLTILPIWAQAELTETATTAVTNMGVGWNLGNTLDANTIPTVLPSNSNYWGQQGLESENCWGQPTTTYEFMTMMQEAGFGAIRVPVTWYNHMTPEGTVDPAWMARVHEVVDYVIDNGMYCILNVHHDTGADQDGKEHWIKASSANFTANQTKFEGLWQQIATEFRDYDEHLLFESYNEMLDTYNSWCFASMNCGGGYNATVANDAYAAINNYAQSFVTTVRATGGNNATRNLVVNTYAACSGVGTWNSHLQDPLTRMNLPTDVAPNHLIFQVHSYPSLVNNNGSSRSINDVKNELNTMFQDLTNNLASKGAPVIVGEWGTSNVDKAGETDYDVRRPLMLQFAAHFVSKAKEHNIGTFFWMGLSDGLFRSMPAFSQPDLAETITKAYHGPDFQGQYPDVQQIDSFVCFEGEKNLGWGDGLTVPASFISMLGESVQLEITYKHTGSGDDIQFYLGDWSDKFTFNAEGRSFTADFNPSRVYSTPVGTTHTTVFTFPKATYDKISKVGIIVHGNNVCINKMTLKGSPASALEDILPETEGDGIYYNLLGQPVVNPGRGIYICNGKKIINN